MVLRSDNASASPTLHGPVDKQRPRLLQSKYPVATSLIRKVNGMNGMREVQFLYFPKNRYGRARPHAVLAPLTSTTHGFGHLSAAPSLTDRGCDTSTRPRVFVTAASAVVLLAPPRADATTDTSDDTRDAQSERRLDGVTPPAPASACDAVATTAHVGEPRLTQGNSHSTLLARKATRLQHVDTCTAVSLGVSLAQASSNTQAEKLAGRPLSSDAARKVLSHILPNKSPCRSVSPPSAKEHFSRCLDPTPKPSDAPPKPTGNLLASSSEVRESGDPRHDVSPPVRSRSATPSARRVVVSFVDPPLTKKVTPLPQPRGGMHHTNLITHNNDSHVNRNLYRRGPNRGVVERGVKATSQEMHSATRHHPRAADTFAPIVLSHSGAAVISSFGRRLPGDGVNRTSTKKKN